MESREETDDRRRGKRDMRRGGRETEENSGVSTISSLKYMNVMTLCEREGMFGRWEKEFV